MDETNEAVDEGKAQQRVFAWMMGGMDAAAFATLLTIAGFDPIPDDLKRACAYLLAAIPLLTGALWFWVIAEQRGVPQNHRLMRWLLLDCAGVGCFGWGVAILAWHISEICALTFGIAFVVAFVATTSRMTHAFKLIDGGHAPEK